MNEPTPPPAPVDFVPHLGLGLGAVSALGSALLFLLGGGDDGGLILVSLVLTAALGFTLGACGLLLALRDGRSYLIALAATALSAILPAYLLAGLPGIR